jgi:hypothetical protein
METKRAAVALALVWLTFSAQGCNKKTAVDPPSGAAASVAPSPQAARSLPPYPPARWRLAMFDELDRTTLWVGHIAIRHEHSDPILFRGGDWRPDDPNPARSSDEAMALAEKIAAEASAAPEQFEQLARTHSEDALSRVDGGMLGGVRASQLAPKDFLDAIAAMKVGEVSRPFATPYGFHILKRYPPPPDEQVGGERIVIEYQGVFGGGPHSSRSRAEALVLANEVFRRAREAPQSFRALVDRYSENTDRRRGGDMGVYSTRDPGYLPVEILHLARLEIGQVTGPLDSPVGFEILKRIPVVPHTEYAMASINLPLQAGATEPDARMKALATAQEMRRTLAAEPRRFEEFQNIRCCDRIQRWTDGRGDDALTRLLDTLAFGEIAPEPILQGGEYLLVKRLDPSRLSAEKPRNTELPTPSEPDYEALLKYNADGRRIAAASRALIEKVQASAGFTPDASRTIVKALGNLASQAEEHSSDHAVVRTAIRATLATLEGELGADRYHSFTAFGREWIKSQLMPSPSIN